MPVAALDSPVEPTASVLPSDESAREPPKPASARVFDALTYACCVHINPVCWQTRTAPAPAAEVSPWPPLMPVAALDSPKEPTASVLPSEERATGPKFAPERAFGAL